MIVREFCALPSSKQRLRGNCTSGILIADISSCRSIDDEKKLLECTGCLHSVRREIFVASRFSRVRRTVLLAPEQKGPWNPVAWCHRHSHRSHPIIFKLGERASRPYARIARTREHICEHVSVYTTVHKYLDTWCNSIRKVDMFVMFLKFTIKQRFSVVNSLPRIRAGMKYTL